jgi:putative membrane protein
LVLVLGFIGAGYAYIFYDLRRQGRLEALLEQGLIKRSQPWYFAAGLATLAMALFSPIDVFSNVLFVMHMTQHVLLIMVAAPLLLLGLPAAFVRPLLQDARLKRVLAWLTHPFTAFTLYNLTLIGWHFPAFYELTLRNPFIHDLEHAMFFYTGLLSWWPLLSPVRELPRLSYPGQMLYIFLIAIPSGLLSAVLVFAERALYPSYAAAPRLWGLTALADQQAGALVMMLPGKAIYLIALTIVFFIWFNEEEPVGQEQLLYEEA